jgi:kinetochore protein Mis13/DSN1
MPPLDGMVAVPLTDTPMIRKNQEMRKEAQRRSSLGLRGQRMSSSLGRGEVSMPHSSVPSSTFYKHISPTLPEPIRAKHLLVWCAKRAPVVRGPTDTDLGDRLCRDIMDDLANLLGAGGVDTNVFADIVSLFQLIPLTPARCLVISAASTAPSQRRQQGV